MVEAALARRVHTHRKPHRQFRGRVVWAGGGAGGDGHTPKVCVTNTSDGKTQSINVQSLNVSGKSEEMHSTSCVNQKQVPDVSHGVNGVPICHILYETVPKSSGQDNTKLGSQCCNKNDSDSDHPSLDPGPSNHGHMGLNLPIKDGHQGLNIATQDSMGLNQHIPSGTEVKANVDSSDHCERSKVRLIYDTKYCGFEDKFTSSILYANQKGSRGDWEVIDNGIHQLWGSQVDFKFGFVPLQKQVLPPPPPPPTYVPVIFLDLCFKYMTLLKDLVSQIFCKLVSLSSLS